MSQDILNGCQPTDAREILTHLLDENLLGLQSGERLWKLYCFRATGQAASLRHRIYTKQKTDGRLALITFAAHNPPRVTEDAFRRRDAPEVRSALARVPDLSASDLDRLITAMRGQTPADVCEEIDLSSHRSLDEQVAWLQGHENE